MYFQSHLLQRLASKNLKALAEQTGIARSTLVRLKEGENEGRIVRLDCQVAGKLMVSLNCQFEQLFSYIHGDEDRTGACPTVELVGTLRFYSQLSQFLTNQGKNLDNLDLLSKNLEIGWATLRMYLEPGPLKILDARTIGRIAQKYHLTLFCFIKIAR
ncbi:MAG: helix-turn-helix domain-containing protein [Microcystaceae cyanobacterium]